MLSVDKAVSQLQDAARILVDAETVPLDAACGRVLAQDVEARADVPGADNSAMDGYALRCDDWTESSTEIEVSQRIPAGARPGPLEPGTAARIFTGAIIPSGADTVVMQENVETVGPGKIRIVEPARKGSNIRQRGQDVRLGDTVLSGGTRLRAQEVGQLAGQGQSEVPCYRRLKVAVLSTGEELVEPGDNCEAWQIYNSNRFSIQAILEGWGMEVVDLGIVRDTEQEVSDALGRASAAADVVVTSGGVSVGEEDHVRDVVASMGKVDLWKVAIKPGKPFVFGEISGTPFIGLPGNPVSVFVTLVVVARSCLLSCQGLKNATLAPFKVASAFERASVSREEYLRVSRTAEGLRLFRSQSSGVLSSLCASDGLARQSSGSAIERGDLLDFFPYELMLSG